MVSMGPNSKIFLLKSYKKNDCREMGWEPICDQTQKQTQEQSNLCYNFFASLISI